jgi:hypothetical protein
MHMNPLKKSAVAAIVAALLVLTSAFVLAQPALAAGCANEAIRAEQGAAALALPDCRAYELVSPDNTPLVLAERGGGEVPNPLSATAPYGMRAADNGDAMAYLSYYPFEGSPSSGFFVRSRRDTTGWRLEAMSPQVLPGASSRFGCEGTTLDYSEDLNASVLTIGRDIQEEFPDSSFCGQPQEKLVPDEPSGFANLLRREAPESPYQLVNLTPPTASPANAQFQDASADLSHVVFSEETRLTPDAPLGNDLYMWVRGAVRLVSVLPDGTPVPGDLVRTGEGEQSSAPFTHAVSSDGERIFFYAQGNLYLRENAGQVPAASPNCLISESSEPGLACTLQVDAPSQTSDPSGGGVFQYASADGSRVFFTDDNRLTGASTAAVGKPDLYERDIVAGIVDRTVGTSRGGADVVAFGGANEDGSRLFFVGEGALTGALENAAGEVAKSGQPNLYLLENGALTFVAPADGASFRFSISPDGRYFGFDSDRDLAGGVTGMEQIFLYDAASQELSCASCLPDGGAPPGPSALTGPIAASELEGAPAYPPRNLTDEGRMFFTTNQPLLPADIAPADAADAADVYEYHHGELNLLSDPGGSGPSFFVAASVEGGDVFLATADALVRSDTDNALNIYDARIDGGFAEPLAPIPPCLTTESCRNGGSGAPNVGPSATTTGLGLGTVSSPKRCKRGQVRRHGKCVKRQKRRGHKRQPKQKTRHGKKRGTRR